jgi:hypothetical protein
MSQATDTTTFKREAWKDLGKLALHHLGILTQMCFSIYFVTYIDELLI